MKYRQPSLTTILEAKKPPKLLDQIKRCIRDKHYSLRTEEAYLYWIRWYIRFHGIRHPIDMGVREVKTFLYYPANKRNVRFNP